MKKEALKQVLFASVCCLLFSTALAAAPVKKPRWVQTPPRLKDTFIGISQTTKATVGDSISADTLFAQRAQSQALLSIAHQLPWPIDTLSMLVELSQKGIYKESFDNILMGKILESPFFKQQGTWENDEEYWCYYSITAVDFQTFLSQLVDSALVSGYKCLEQGLDYQEQGYLYKAAVQYAKALNCVHPILFKQVPVTIKGKDVELCKAIYTCYVNVYRNITLKPSITEVPALYNEAVPYAFNLSVLQGSTALPKMGVLVEYKGGMLTADPTTDSSGRCSIKIENVTSHEEKQNMRFSLDESILFDVPQTFATEEFNKQAFPSVDLPIVLFDPHTFVYVHLNQYDSLLYETVKDELMQQQTEVRITNNADSADLTLNIQVETKKGSDFEAGKFVLCQCNSSLDLSLNTKKDENLVHYSISDFKTMVPASKSEAAVFQSSVREMVRQLKRELPKQLATFNYNKRSVVWQTLANHLE